MPAQAKAAHRRTNGALKYGDAADDAPVRLNAPPRWPAARPSQALVVSTRAHSCAVDSPRPGG